MNQDERRAFPRIPLLTDVTLTAGAERRSGAMRDISLGGMCIKVDDVDVDSTWTVALQLPGDDPLLTLNAKVAWARNDEAGLTFAAEEREALSRIEAAVQRELTALESFKDEKTPARDM